MHELFPENDFKKINLKLRDFLTLIDGHSGIGSVELCDSYGYVSDSFREKHGWKGNKYYNVADNYSESLWLKDIIAKKIIPEAFLDNLGVKSWRPHQHFEDSDKVLLFINVYELKK